MRISRRTLSLVAAGRQGQTSEPAGTTLRQTGRITHKLNGFPLVVCRQYLRHLSTATAHQQTSSTQLPSGNNVNGYRSAPARLNYCYFITARLLFPECFLFFERKKRFSKRKIRSSITTINMVRSRGSKKNNVHQKVGGKTSLILMFPVYSILSNTVYQQPA